MVYYILGLEGWSVYYIRMVQPKSAPLSLRIPPELLAAIDAMAERRKIKRHAAIVLALSIGERTDSGFDPKWIEGLSKDLAVLEAAKTVVAKAEPLRTPAAPYGSRLKKR